MQERLFRALKPCILSLGVAGTCHLGVHGAGLNGEGWEEARRWAGERGKARGWGHLPLPLEILEVSREREGSDGEGKQDCLLIYQGTF